MKKSLVLVIGFLWLFTGCAGVQQRLTPDEITSKFEVIATLKKELKAAEENGIDVFAPEGFLEAKKLYTEAFQMAGEGKSDQPVHLANKGLSALAKAKSDAKHAQEIMWEVIDVRQRARNAGAPELFGKEYKATEKKLAEANRLIEGGSIAKAKDLRPSLINSYNEMEIDALKKGVVSLAKASVQQAKAKGAGVHAPATYRKAETELNMAISILETDRTQTEKANAHAKLATEMANRTTEITELVKTFKRRKYSMEDIILWYQKQLFEINKPLSSELDFEQPNHIVVRSLHDTIAAQVESQKDSARIAGEKQKRIHELEAELKGLHDKYEYELSDQTKRQMEIDRIKQEADERFRHVQSLFTPQEAEVYRKGDNVLIKAHGFYFPSGEAEIKTINFPLMNKLINAIRKFPGSKIEVSGHTDATGSAEKNLLLSKDRAKNVADFLINVGHVKRTDITVNGYGETRPIASNDTEEGRAQNRRIELLIVNE
ncbi:MAG: OmpA family protein [Deltaproteobacteria bacterium]|jgi:outer membrane protein OmpA-like peptidoglycan-associated protein|nr:OmpA family protein [Deltaproteobacteria bacterium]